jgi:hypothetical protein
MTTLIGTGLVREIAGDLLRCDTAHIDGLVPIHRADGLVMGATLLVLLRAFAIGGASLTGTPSGNRLSGKEIDARRAGSRL